LDTEDLIGAYLDPQYENLVSVDDFLGIKEAVNRIAEAKNKKEKILIYGDYDVDGVTATALILESLNRVGIQGIETYIPHREEEGYGLNKEALREIKKSGAKLVITVDCGITSANLIDSDPDLEFIVIDHHEIDKKKLPKKSINIHPSLTRSKKEYFLSGCGTAFFLARGLQKKFQDIYSDGQEKWLLDLVALATICDIVPLMGDNRILATWGLAVINKTKREGLLALARVASLEIDKIGAYEVGFILGPRLNAAGRIDHAKLALEILTTRDKIRAYEVAKNLNQLNLERQEMCERILAEAREEVKKTGQQKHKVFLLSNKNWPRGVVGIIASRISEEHNKPVIVFEDDGDYHHGSARSIDGFDIVEALGGCADCLEKFGGHSKAAGLTVSRDKFVLFSDKLVEIADKKIKKSDLVKKIEIDTEIKISEINNEALDLISKMNPVGYGNSRPIFMVRGVAVTLVTRVGKNKEHLKFRIQAPETNNQGAISGIVFNEDRELVEGQEYDMVGTLKYNIWNGRKSIDFGVIDFRESGEF